jgi:hypothetical protein
LKAWQASRMRSRWTIAVGLCVLAACSPAGSAGGDQQRTSIGAWTVPVAHTTKLGVTQPLVVTLLTVIDSSKVAASLGQLDLESNSNVLLSPEGLVYVMSLRRDTQAWVVDMVDEAARTSRRYELPAAFSPQDRSGGSTAAPFGDWRLGPDQVLYATDRLDWSRVVAVPTSGERAGQIVAQAQRPNESADRCTFVSAGIACDGQTMLGWVDAAGRPTGRTYDGTWMTIRPSGWLTNATGQALVPVDGGQAASYDGSLPSGRPSRFEQAAEWRGGYFSTIRSARFASGECALIEASVEWHTHSVIACVGNDGIVRSSAIPRLARSTYTFEAQMITDVALYFVKRDPAGSILYRFRLFADT